MTTKDLLNYIFFTILVTSVALNALQAVYIDSLKDKVIELQEER